MNLKSAKVKSDIKTKIFKKFTQMNHLVIEIQKAIVKFVLNYQLSIREGKVTNQT